MARHKQWGLAVRAPRPVLPDADEQQAIIAACQTLIRDVLKPKFLPEIRPGDHTCVIDIH
jgi:hypothetical protein